MHHSNYRNKPKYTVHQTGVSQYNCSSSLFNTCSLHKHDLQPSRATNNYSLMMLYTAITQHMHCVLPLVFVMLTASVELGLGVLI